MLRRFQRGLRERPALTNGVMAAAVMGAGDAVSQVVVEGGQFDGTRACVASVWGGGINAPFFVALWSELERRFPGTAPRRVLAKVALTASIAPAPLFAGFVAFKATLEAAASGEPGALAAVPAEVLQRWREDTVDAVLASAKLWVPINTLTFMCVPPHLRLLPTTAAGVVWSVYLSTTAHRSLG